MISMTGFGRGKAQWGDAAIVLTLSCVNKRGREISVNLPRELAEIEGEISEALRKAFERGKLQLNAKFESLASQTGMMAVAKQRLAILKKTCKALKVPCQPDANLMWKILQTPAQTKTTLSPKAMHAIKTALNSAISACQKAQANEGARLQKDFATHLKQLEKLHQKAKDLAQTSLPQRQQRLLKNLTQAGLEVEQDDERLIKELAIFADRVDIAEELVRIQAHLTSATDLITKNNTGRELEFVLQELLREWNTLGNKSQIIELVQTALNAKNEVDKLREQAANIA